MTLMPKNESDKSGTSATAGVSELSRDFGVCFNGDPFLGYPDPLTYKNIHIS